jgi:transposase
MIHLTIAEADQQAIAYERYHHPDPRVQRKMEILWLKKHELPTPQIAQLAGVCPNTVRNCFHEYIEGGLEQVKTLDNYRPESELAAHQTTLEKHFKEHPPATIKKAAHEIAELTGKRSATPSAHLLKKNGLKCRKVGMTPAKADPDVHTALEPCCARAKPPGACSSGDGHTSVAPLLGVLVVLTAFFIQAPAGRQRFNVLGLLNAITPKSLP